MNSTRKALAKHPIFKITSSIKITTVCLTLLFILTLWGTFEQVEYGLYMAQERIFNSLFFVSFGFLPFPGVRLIMWIMFINLSSIFITRLVYRWSHIGIVITHVGLMVFFLSSFVTYNFSKESVLSLLEGEASNVSAAYYDWEICLWDKDEKTKTVWAFDTTKLRTGEQLHFTPHALTLDIEQYYGNADAFLISDRKEDQNVINQTGIKRIKEISMATEPETNVPGVIFQLKAPDNIKRRVLLYGNDPQPTKITINNKDYYFGLRKKRFTLPFSLKLLDFEMDNHPGTSMARSYKSKVQVIKDGVTRDVQISMNKPLTHEDFTFYQASYAIDQMGNERSVLAVVENSGKYLPYIASFTTFAGMVIHLLFMAFKRPPKKKAVSHV